MVLNPTTAAIVKVTTFFFNVLSPPAYVDLIILFYKIKTYVYMKIAITFMYSLAPTQKQFVSAKGSIKSLKTSGLT
jgi:hypothetical protein